MASIFGSELTRELFNAGIHPRMAAAALVKGVQDGRTTAIREAPYIEDTLGFKPDMRYVPIEIGPLPDRVLGVTNITPEGKAVGIRISNSIPKMMLDMAKAYHKSDTWTLSAIYQQAKHTTEHEDYHKMSAHLAKGEPIDDKARDVMESVTTRGRYVMKKRLGKHDEAEFVKATNPYPGAWAMSAVADWAPYEGPSGNGYKGFLGDASQEKFYKPLWRLTKSAAKAAISRGREAIRDIGASSYVPQAA